MTESPEEQVAKVVDDAVARRDPNLPTWATARLTRVFRGLDVDERHALVERVTARPGVSGGLAADVRVAAERAAAPAPPPPARPAAAPAPVRAPAKRTAPRAPRRTAAAYARTSTFKARSLDEIPPGTRVEYQGRGAVIEPPWLVLDDGRKFKFLNPAAVYINGGVEVNGWDAWKLPDGRSLGECYDSGSWPSTPETESETEADTEL